MMMMYQKRRKKICEGERIIMHNNKLGNREGEQTD
jgi:hypothetical protein